MKRHFIKKPVIASTSFWSTDVNSEEDIKAEIQKALDAGTTFEDVDDYLNELYNLEIIDDEQFSELINWASPLTSNSNVYSATEARSARARFEVGSTYTGSSLYGGQITYKVVSRTVTTVSLAESHISEDDWSEVDDGVKEYNIVMQDMYDADYENVIGKQEAVVIWEYSGHEGYLFARDSKVGYDEEDAYEDGYMDAYEEYSEASRRDDYTPSSTRGNYSPSNPWDAPGMSMRDFM